jgi:hypothetical protein
MPKQQWSVELWRGRMAAAEAAPERARTAPKDFIVKLW